MKYKVIILFLFAMFSHIGYAQDASGTLAATGSSLNTVLAIAAVAVILVLSYLVVKYKKKATISLPSKEETVVTTELPEEKPANDVVEPDSGEIYAVIAMALTEALYEDHDDENMILTMKEVSRSYSPWSSKIYTLREIPKR